MTERRLRLESLGVSLPGRRLWPRGAVAHAVAAGRRCLKASRYHPTDVAVLINAGLYHDEHVCEPAVACYIQRQLGINPEFQERRTLAFDLADGAVGMLRALQVVGAQLLAGEAGVGMVVSSESNRDRRPDPAWHWPASGAALLVDLAPQRDGPGFGPLSFRSRPELADLFTAEVSLQVPYGRIQLAEKRAELEEAWLGLAAEVTAEALERAQLTPDRIDRVIPAQLSADFIARLPKALGMPADRITDLTAKLPDTHSTAVFLALHQSQATTPLAPGQTALLLAFGSGPTVAATTLRF